MSESKFTPCAKFIFDNKLSWLAITELVVNENTSIPTWLHNHDRYPVLSHDDCPRVGLMIPKYLENQFQVLEAIPITQDRKRNSNKVCQITVFKYNDSKITKHKNCIILGDINLDQKKSENVEFINSYFDGLLSQKVNKPTRISKRTVDGNTTISETIIDLVYLDNEMNEIFLDLDVLPIADSPSDHSFIKFNLLHKVNTKFVDHEFYMDTTKRRPFSKKNLPLATRFLAGTIKNKYAELENFTQSQIFEYLEVTLRATLDLYAPHNDGLKKTRKMFRVPVSDEFRALSKKRFSILGEWRKIRRMNPDIVTLCKVDDIRKRLREANNAVKYRHKKDCYEYHRNLMKSDIENSKDVWDFIKRCQSRPTDQRVPDLLNIGGKTGNDLANHMADFLHKRANLVSSTQVKAYANHIPWPQNIPVDTICLDGETELPRRATDIDAEKVYKKGSKPSLACGPDSISLRHITDLMPTLKRVLNLALNKPVDMFHNISTSYNRLISKDPGKKQVLTEKSQRPIAELNLLPKYGPIKDVMEQFREKMIPYLSKDQFALPGKGCPVATATILDELNAMITTGYPTLLILWDFSNAFCTYDHEIAMEIFAKFNLSNHLLGLIKQFLQQDKFSVKMMDAQGFYLSKMVQTGVGGQQGQIGTDFLFTVLNDGIRPQNHHGVACRRFKYVDDFQDIFCCKEQELLFDSLVQNMDLIFNQATSLGLKLNESKLKILPFNIDTSKLHPAFKCVPDSNLLVPKDADLTDPDIGKLPNMLGFGFDKSTQRGPLKINGGKAASKCLSRLRACYPIIMTLRKTERNVMSRLKLATQLVWTCCFDLGLIACYASGPQFEEISTAHRKLIKLAGIDQLAPSSIVYKLSTTISTKQIADKQILCLGLKMVDRQVVENNRYLVPALNAGPERPFWSKFRNLFNALPKTTRQFMTERIDPRDKGKAASVKEHLMKFYRHELDPSGPLDDKKKEKLLKKYRYSRLRVIARIEASKSLQHKRTHTTPGQRSNINAKCNSRLFFGPKKGTNAKAFAPLRIGIEKLQDGTKRRIFYPVPIGPLLSKSVKRKNGPRDMESTPNVKNKRRRRLRRGLHFDFDTGNGLNTDDSDIFSTNSDDSDSF
jgi:hypothetical protein